MDEEKELYRYGRGGTSQYHKLVNRDRTASRTYRLSKELAADITCLANKYRISSNDLANWCLQQAVDQMKSGAIAPKIETVIGRCI
jgi:hypothetical protein